MTTFILVETQLPENLGAVARVMKNFGHKDLRLVSPLLNPLEEKAINCSTGAGDILKNALVFDSLEEALSPFEIVYGTGAKQRDIIQTYITPRTAFNKTDPAQKTAIVFGPERTGLRNEHFALCHQLIQIPVNPDFSSLNISHAVGLIAYEFSYLLKENEATHFGETSRASHQQIQHFIRHLESHLDEVNFWRDSRKKPIMLRNIKAFFNRQILTSQDLKTLSGIVRFLSKIPQKRKMSAPAS